MQPGMQQARRGGQIAIQELWPTTLFISDWPDQQARGPAICDMLRAQSRSYKAPIASGVALSSKSSTGLVESPLNLFQTTIDPNLQALASWIGNAVRSVVRKMTGANVAPERLQVEFTDSWFHITNEGGFHDAHVHGNCSWCGIFYLEAGESAQVTGPTSVAGNGVNRFYSPIGMGGLVSDFGNSYLNGRHYVDVQPVNGRLVIFPAYLLHSALPYRGSSDRIVIAFNSRTHLIAEGAGAAG